MNITILQRGKDFDEDMRTDPNWSSLLRQESIHYVSIAMPGLNVVSANILGAGFDHRERNDFMMHVNHARETGTLYPKTNITLLPSHYASYGGIDQNIYKDGGYSKTEVIAHIKDAFEVNSQYIKSRTMYFDFRGLVSEALYVESLKAAMEQVEDADLPEEVITWEPKE